MLHLRADWIAVRSVVAHLYVHRPLRSVDRRERVDQGRTDVFDEGGLVVDGHGGALETRRQAVC